MKTNRTERNRSHFQFFRRLLTFLTSLTHKSLPEIGDNTPIDEVFTTYPAFHRWLEKRYTLYDNEPAHHETFSQFCERFNLPPARILFMQWQLDRRLRAIQHVSAREAQALLEEDRNFLVVDAREAWEWEHGKLPGAIGIQTFLKDWKDRFPCPHPVLIYCHYGIRSLDAALYLRENGVSSVYLLEGGIEAWSQNVDPTIPTYDGHPC